MSLYKSTNRFDEILSLFELKSKMSQIGIGFQSFYRTVVSPEKFAAAVVVKQLAYVLPDKAL